MAVCDICGTGIKDTEVYCEPHQQERLLDKDMAERAKIAEARFTELLVELGLTEERRQKAADHIDMLIHAADDLVLAGDRLRRVTASTPGRVEWDKAVRGFRAIRAGR